MNVKILFRTHATSQPDVEYIEFPKVYCLSDAMQKLPLVLLVRDGKLYGYHIADPDNDQIIFRQINTGREIICAH